MTNSKEYLATGHKPVHEFDDKTPIELVALLESKRESAGVSLQVMVSVLLPQISLRAYKKWLAFLADPDGGKNMYRPQRHRRAMLVKAIKALIKCLRSGALPKTRLQINQEGKQVVQYKKEILKLAKQGKHLVKRGN